jgi:hypothetical protein
LTKQVLPLFVKPNGSGMPSSSIDNGVEVILCDEDGTHPADASRGVTWSCVSELAFCLPACSAHVVMPARACVPCRAGFSRRRLAQWRRPTPRAVCRRRRAITGVRAAYGCAMNTTFASNSGNLALLNVSSTTDGVVLGVGGADRGRLAAAQRHVRLVSHRACDADARRHVRWPRWRLHRRLPRAAHGLPGV